MQWNVAYKLTQKIYKSKKILCMCQHLFLLPWFYLLQKPMKIQHIRHVLLSRDADMDRNLQIGEWTGSHMATPLALQRWRALTAFESLLWSHSSEETHCTPLGATIRFYSGKLIYFMCSHWQKRQKLLSEDISLWWLYTCDLLKIRSA